MSFTYRGPMTDEQAAAFLDDWYSRSISAVPGRGSDVRAAAEGTVKLSWKRDPGAPAGQPATGTFTCPCGTASGPRLFGQSPDWECGGCDRTWDNRGWLVAGPAQTEER